MKTVEVQLPDSIRLQLEEMAKLEGISLNQMLVTAASNEIIRQETRGFFNQISRNYSLQMRWLPCPTCHPLTEIKSTFEIPKPVV